MSGQQANRVSLGMFNPCLLSPILGDTGWIQGVPLTPLLGWGNEGRSEQLIDPRRSQGQMGCVLATS